MDEVMDDRRQPYLISPASAAFIKLANVQSHRTLVKLLEAGAQQYLWGLAKRCNQVLDIYRSPQAEDYIIDSNDQALKNLEWVYLKVLVARHHLMSPSSETEETLVMKIRGICRDLQDAEETESLRQSKTDSEYLQETPGKDATKTADS